MKPQIKSEDTLIKNLRDRAENTPAVTLSKTTPIGKEEAMSEAEYIVKRILLESKPTTLEESQKMLEHAFKLAYTYLNKVNVHIDSKELVEYLTREVTQNG
jgi:exonuclease VII small subunit